MGLKEYKAKRKFNETPEPSGKEAPSKGELKFVIQKHAASHLHYDFRLEMDGVMKSWAIPKGPSLNPKDKRLAMMVEDHPMDYRTFEGIIPEGNYGAGTVMVWDEGTFTALPGMSRKEAEKELLKGLGVGKITFTMYGSKVQGEFALVKIKDDARNSKGNSWLLIKHKDEHVSETDLRKRNTSAVTDRTLEEIREAEAKKGGSQWGSEGRIDTGKAAKGKAAADKGKHSSEREDDGTLRKWDRDFEETVNRSRWGSKKKQPTK